MRSWLKSALFAGLAAESLVVAAPHAERANSEKKSTISSRSPTSNVKGKAFDRFAIIYLENTDYDKAMGDRKHIEKQC